MQYANIRQVLSLIQSEGELSRAQVAALTGMNIMTVGRIVENMIARGILQERETEALCQVGRPPRLLSLRQDRLLCASLFLARDKLHLGLVSLTGQVEAYRELPVPEGDFVPEAVLPWMADSLERFLSEHQDRDLCRTIGAVVPGILDIGRGEVVFSANFQWSGVPLLEQLRRRLPDYDFILENDVKAVAVAEHQFGSAKGFRNVVVLNIGDGVGAAVILNDEIYRGKDNMAGEIGHIILNPAGKICECGKAGCLQTYLSQRTLLAEARAVYPHITLDQLFELYQRGETFVSAMMNQVGEYVAIAVNLLANTYAPDVVLLCGSMVRQGPVLSEIVKDMYQEKLNQYMKDTFQLRFERFGITGHLIGGGVLAMRQALKNDVFTTPPAARKEDAGAAGQRG